MKMVRVLGVAVILGLGVIAGFIYSGLYDVSATSPHGGFANWLMSTTMNASVERRAKNLTVPDLDDEALQLAGINDFDTMCAACHGAPGRDPEAIGQGLNPPAPDLAESSARRTAAELFWITKSGIRMTGMPAWGASHEDEELWPVVAFMTVLPGLSAEAYQSMLAGAVGSGHHAADGDVHNHADAEVESGGHRGEDHPGQDQADNGETPEHDHSSHSHGGDH